jgi:hypothetical protein
LKFSHDSLSKKTTFQALPAFLLAILLFSRILFSGEALYWGVPALQFVPWRALAWDSLRQGVWPLWNPLNGLGAPLLANYQLAIYYPPGWILYGLAWLGGVPWMAWGHTLLVVLHLGWAGLGMVKLAADLGVKPFGRVIAALAFALSGYLIARAGFFSMIWTAAWFPWVILYASQIGAPLSDRASKTGGISIRLVLSLAMMLLAGHAQLSWYILIFTGAWVLVGAGMQGGWRRAVPAVGLLILCGLLAGVLAGAQLAPTAEYLLQSQRSSAVSNSAIVFILAVAMGHPGCAGFLWESRSR